MTAKIYSCAAVLGLVLAGCSLPWSDKADSVTVKIVAFNDFHGQLDAPAAGGQDAGDTPLGGVEWFAGYVQNLRKSNPHTFVVSAGDLIGASPLLSALFHDEPTIEAMNRLGLDLNAVGNHEFDQGRGELLRMQQGGCHSSPGDTCRGADVGTPVPFEGARFGFLAANVVDAASGTPLFPPYAIKQAGGVPVGFIGLTLTETATVVSPPGIAGLKFLDEADTVNALVPELRAQGVEAIVVLIHQGGTVPDAPDAVTINQCAGDLAGSPIQTIVGRFDDAVDLVVSGHTHQAYLCRIASSRGRHIPVTSAGAHGRLLTDIDMTLDRDGDVKSLQARNFLVDGRDKEVQPVEAIRQLVARYREIAKPLSERVIGRIGATISRQANAAGESALGDLVADAQLLATQGEAVIAFTNPGALRADLVFQAERGGGTVSYAEAFGVQPFGDNLVTLTLSGRQIHAALEQQFPGCNLDYPVDAQAAGQPVARILQVSAGFSYRWQASGPPCEKVDPADIRLNGETLQPNQSYRVTMNSFLAEGGDQFYAFRQGGERRGGPVDLDALLGYFAGRELAQPNKPNRITRRP